MWPAVTAKYQRSKLLAAAHVWHDHKLLPFLLSSAPRSPESHGLSRKQLLGEFSCVSVEDVVYRKLLIYI